VPRFIEMRPLDRGRYLNVGVKLGEDKGRAQGWV